MAACCLTGTDGFIATAARADPSLTACEQAGVAAEQANGLPAGLLLAIGRVESGRWDSLRHRVVSWPWAINAAGKGQWFDSADAAARSVRTLLGSGVRSIDVGCFQISLLYHPQAFASLEEGFDPDANARYAAHFLLSLFSRTGSWESAVQAYHSADPALGFAYRAQVYASWTDAPAVTALARLPVPERPLERTVALSAAFQPRAVELPMVIAGVRIWTPMPIGEGATVVTMPRPSDPRAAAAGPLPVVSYRVMPAGIIPVSVTPRR